MFGDWFLGSVLFHVFSFFFVPWGFITIQFKKKSGEIFWSFWKHRRFANPKIVDALLVNVGTVNIPYINSNHRRFANLSLSCFEGGSAVLFVFLGGELFSSPYNVGAHTTKISLKPDLLAWFFLVPVCWAYSFHLGRTGLWWPNSPVIFLLLPNFVVFVDSFARSVVSIGWYWKNSQADIPDTEVCLHPWNLTWKCLEKEIPIGNHHFQVPC